MEDYLDDIDQIQQLTATDNEIHILKAPNFQGKEMIKGVEDFQVFKDDPYLKPHMQHFRFRFESYTKLLKDIKDKEKGLLTFAEGYKRYGLIKTENSIIYREWAPGAKKMYLTGDFCNWDKKKWEMKKDEFGSWSIELPDVDGEPLIRNGSKIKVHLLSAKDEWVDRIPVYIKCAIQEQGQILFDGIFWNPPKKHQFKYDRPKRFGAPKIYETHIGMAGVEPKVHTFQEFITTVLPRIKKLGYNIIQIMAIAEHSYYGSFGYHVTLPFAISSRFGTPEDFKQLVDACHGEGIAVLMDIVHSHACKNILDGINEWDGTDYMYFHGGPKGLHPLWDSKVFNYGHWETLRMLLSNISYFMNEYKVDGFRFDGVTSMLYQHHGSGVGFTGNYEEYFGNLNVEMDAVIYMMLANELIHRIYPQALSIAEDVSGYPTLCRPVSEGGVGFDFRLAMAIPDLWIKMLKEKKDDEWDMGNLAFTLTNRRYKEPCIVYCESHDQALVGDKTLAMWLMDKEMYNNMSLLQQPSMITSRGIALHKMLRLLTIGLGGEGWLCFMGNEFGHPEWIDFPRLGNNWSYHHCRRRFDLADDKTLRYQSLEKFDEEMIKLDIRYHFLGSYEQYVTEKNNDSKVIIFERGPCLFVFNFHPTQSFTDFKVGTKWDQDHIQVLDTDRQEFGGIERLNYGNSNAFPIHREPYQNRPNYIKLYIPSRTGIVLVPYNKLSPQDLKNFENAKLGKIQKDESGKKIEYL